MTGIAAPPSYLRRRYALDRLLAALLAVLVAPLLLAVALWVLVVDGRPVLFWQPRFASGETVVGCPKFRTFRRDHDPAALARRVDGSLISVRANADLLAGAATIRQLGLDELPQLLLVARGAFALIGPRPLPAAYAAEQRLRPRWLRPGVIGLAQATGRRALPLADRHRLDLEYAVDASPALDLRIIARTAAAVLGGQE